MPTKNPAPTVEINFLQFLMPSAVDIQGLRNTLQSEYARLRFGGLASREQWLAVFDPARTDLSTLPIGVLDKKMLILPRRYLPKSIAGLKQLCQRLIDAGGDLAHIHSMVQGWPDGFTLDRHVDDLWSLRAHDRLLYEDIVRGRLGRALCRLEQPRARGSISVPDIWAMIVRQALLWCAFDVQVVAARARASFVGPLGRLLKVTLRGKPAQTIIKPATALRLMRLTAPILQKTLADHIPKERRKEGEENKAKPRGRIARDIHYQAEKRINSGSKTVAAYQDELDEVIPYLSSLAVDLPQFIDRLERYRIDQLNRDRDPERAVESNGLFLLHAIWNSNLTPIEGLAVALFRYVTAERVMREMMGFAALGMSADGIVKTVNPLPPLPSNPKELRQIKRRVFNLLDSARRVQLDDKGWRSRDTEQRDHIKAELGKDPTRPSRQSHERGGWTAIDEALRFLSAMGRRERNPLHPRFADDDRHRTYWHLDVVPELRFFL